MAIKDPKRAKAHWRSLPYGVWLLKDGTEVLFNRDYNPIMARDKKNILFGMGEGTFIHEIEYQTWFYDEWMQNKLGPKKITLKGQEILAAFANRGEMMPFSFKTKGV